MLAKIYNVHWLELYSVNSALHANPDQLSKGSLVNVGVLYRISRAQTLSSLAQYLHTSPSAIRLHSKVVARPKYCFPPEIFDCCCRRFNPDILADNEILGDFRDVCILPQVCGNGCGYAATCDRVSIHSEFLV